MTSRITRIDAPGGSGPVPTGAVRFQNDWPGLFIRGDDAISLWAGIRELERKLADHPDTAVASALLKLKKLADIIGRDVMVRNADDPP